jgi:hypothetical protein
MAAHAHIQVLGWPSQPALGRRVEREGGHDVSGRWKERSEKKASMCRASSVM